MLTAIAAVLISTTSVAIPAVISDKPVTDALDAYCRVNAQSGFSGTVLAIRDGEVVLQQGYGLANREREIGNTPETLFEIASLSKQFTAAAILKLEQDGRLSIDDRIGQHLPGVPDVYETVTIQHLLTHTGGLPAGGPGRGLDLEQAVRAHLGQPPIGKPGEKYAYSNVGYALLSGIVEQASGTSFEAYCRKMLFQPAGMTATGFCGEEFDDAHVALGYSARGGVPRAPNIDPYPPHDQFGYEYRGMGGVVTNAIDLARWYHALQDDTILAKEAVTKLFTPVTRNYACGWEVFQFPDGRQCIGHGGSVQGFVCKLWMFPEDQSLLLVLSNNDAFDYSWFNGLYNILFDVPERESNRRVPPPPQFDLPNAIPATDAELDELVGAYTSSGDIALGLKIRRKGEGLATTITAPALQAPLNDHEDLQRLTKNIIDGLSGGDVSPLADTMMPNIPSSWPETIRTLIWPSHLQRMGALEGYDVLGVEPVTGMGGDIVLTWVWLRHANGEAVAMLGYRGVRLQLLVLDISEYFCSIDSPSFLKRADGSFMAERNQSFPSVLTQQADGAIGLESGGIGLSFVRE